MNPTTIRVLLVEDNPSEAELVRDMLAGSRRERFEVEHVARLAPGLERLARPDIDVVLLDFSLPDCEGPATFERVAQRAPDVPVVILTNLADETVAAQAVRAGAQDYLIKREINAATLTQSIRYAIERQRSEEALRRSEERYALAVEGANDGIWDWDVGSDTVYFSPRCKALLSLDAGEASTTLDGWLERVHEDDRAALRRALDVHLAGGSPHFEIEHRLAADGNGERWVLARGIVVRDATAVPLRMAGSLTDITARKRAEERLLHDAFHDALTDLPNRSLFTDRLALALEQLSRPGRPGFAVLFLDLDRFKNVNDSLGHTTGDELLIAVAHRLRACIRPGDSVARLGGDEFGALLTNIPHPRDATRVADRIHRALREPFLLGGHEVYTSASIGIAVGTTTYERAEDVLRDADTAMYRAKAAGRACSQVFDRAMHDSVTSLLRMEMGLRRAVERGEFVMHYQPIVTLTDGRIVGFEGLIRWTHPERGLIYPEQFLAVAEETGLIVPIGWQALADSCRQLGAWQKAFPLDPPLYVCVNVSGKVFGQDEMVRRVSDLLDETGILPGTLRLEITENVLLEDANGALETLAALRSLGVRLSCDDFGTGYSSLSYLQRFSYDTLKIDRTFVAEMANRPDNSVIVETIVTLGNLLGMSVVAEGVETLDQLERLQAMRCPEGQGFWFSRPVESREAEALLSNGRVF